MIREAQETDQVEFNSAAKHPLQSWQWGEFRKKTGVSVTRLVKMEDKDIKEVYQVTWHKIPKTNRCIGYCPKSAIPTREVLTELSKIAKNKKAIMVKFEPNEKKTQTEVEKIDRLAKDHVFVTGRPLFTHYSFLLDISKSEEELLAAMHQKTRYNLRLAEKKGVKIVEDNSEKGFEEYWRLTEETTKRQKFFAHTKKYHHQMWQTMISEGDGHLLKAVYEGEILTTWVLFELNGVLYYPYGASTNTHREVMANNLMMWEAIRLGKKLGCKSFDLWGSLGPEPDTADPWYGFHKFKQGYGAELVEFVGTYDLIINNAEYKVYLLVDSLRKLFLKGLAGFRK